MPRPVRSLGTMGGMLSTPGLSPGDLSPAPSNWWTRLWRPFWAVPLALIVGSWLVALALPAVDGRISHIFPYVFSGGPDGARTVLSTIASAMISVTGLVFSITMVVLQLASSQFSPRVLTAFLHNRVSQVTLGIFIATFLFSLTVLRSIQGSQSAQVPQASVTLAFLLVIASVIMFVAFIQHITRSIQVTEVISGVGDSTARVLSRYYPQEPPAITDALGPQDAVDVPLDERHGTITDIKYAGLVDLAREVDGFIELAVRHGDFRTQGQLLARAAGQGGPVDADRLRACVALATGHDLQVDPGYGFRQIVDIASRSLSPGINDPTTAVECLDELHRLLRIVVQRHDPSPILLDDEDRPRVRWRPQPIGDLISLAFVEPIHYGADAPAVRRRILECLDDLDSCTLPEHADRLTQMRGLLEDRSR